MEKVHLIGIGGSGLSAIARLLIESDYTVSGSDLHWSPLLEQLRLQGVQVFVGHHPENVLGADLVVRSSAIPNDNVEVMAAITAGIPVYKRADFLGRLMEGRFGVAVAGTHGKTTTTAMISWLLTALGQDPSYLIGGISKNLGSNAHAGQGATFVIEADEYDRMFLGLRPHITVVTSIEHDHPDCFPTYQDFFQAFVEFIDRIPQDGILIACSDDPGAHQLIDIARQDDRHVLTYGLMAYDSPLDYSAEQLKLDTQGNHLFKLAYGGKPLIDVQLSVPGLHNVQNALAALAVVHQMKLPIDIAASALGEYQGTHRRFDLRGEVGGVVVIDDYAHHPAEIKATLAAARQRYPDRRLWAVWQPHTFSRTKTLFRAFTSAFEEADQVLILEVFGAREVSPDGFSARSVVESINAENVRFTPTIAEAAELLLHELFPGDVLVVLSAGDADQLSGVVLEGLSQTYGGRDE